VLWLDLDGLKRINDVFGHAAGDALIQEAARRIQAAAGPDAVCARLGGDEFAVLLPNLPATRLAEDSARHLLECLRAPYALQGQQLRTTASIGIAADEPELPRPLETLLLRADIAMYRAKARGRDTYVLWDGEGEHTDQAALFQFTRPQA
jgi:diguanylate cyclase (GGDEF)-like protein